MPIVFGVFEHEDGDIFTQGTRHVRELDALYQMSSKKGSLMPSDFEKKYRKGWRPGSRYPLLRPIKAYLVLKI